MEYRIYRVDATVVLTAGTDGWYWLVHKGMYALPLQAKCNQFKTHFASREDAIRCAEENNYEIEITGE